MKTKHLILMLIVSIYTSCSVGVKKDLLSGLKVSNNGLSFDEAYLVIDSTKLTTNEFLLDKKVSLYVEGIEGFTNKDGMVYAGASMLITDENGNKIMDESDLFGDATLTLEASKTIKLFFTVGAPLVQGSKYNWKSKIWDKNGKGTIDTEIEFTVK